MMELSLNTTLNSIAGKIAWHLGMAEINEGFAKADALSLKNQANTHSFHKVAPIRMSKNSTYSDEQIIKALQSADFEEASKMLAFLHGQKNIRDTVWHQIRKFDSKSEDDFFSILHDSLIGLKKSVNTPQFHLRHSLATYFSNIVHKRAIDYFSKKKGMSGVEGLDANKAVGNMANDPRSGFDMKDVIDFVFRKLPERCQYLIHGYFIIGKTYPELAIQMNDTEGNLRTAMYRCKGKFREIYDKLL